jgi:hypothetical protein
MCTLVCRWGVNRVRQIDLHPGYVTSGRGHALKQRGFVHLSSSESSPQRNRGIRKQVSMPVTKFSTIASSV